MSDGTTTSLPDLATIEAGQCGANLPVIDAVSATPDKPNDGDVVALSAMVSHADESGDCKLERGESYAWSFTKVPPGSATELLASSTATPSFVPDKDGDYEVSLVVTDDLGQPSAAKKLVVSVGSCGTAAPSIAKIESSPATPGVGTPVELSGTVEDADTVAPCTGTETFSYAWTFVSVPAGSKASFNLQSLESPSFTADVAGKYVVGLTATDTAGHMSPIKTAEITVTECGAGVPSVTAITPLPTAPAIGQLVALGATVEDADTAPACGLTESVGYAWSLVGVPAGSNAALNGASLANPSFTPDVAGDYVVSLTVTDSQKHQSLATQQKITTTTCGKTPPVAQVAQLFPDAVAAGANIVGPKAPVSGTVQLSAASSSDPDNTNGCGPQSLSYHWSFSELPAGSNASLNDATVANPSFVADVIGKYVVSLVVTDSTNLKSTATFTVNADPSVNVALTSNFTVSTIAGGTAQGFSVPRGIALDAATPKGIYVAMSGTSRIRKISGGSVTTFASGGLLFALQDIAYDSANNAFYVTGSERIVKLSSTGVQSQCVTGEYRGVDVGTVTGNNRRILATNRGSKRVDLLTTNCTTASTNDFNGSNGGKLEDPWGIAFGVITSVDNMFSTNRSSNELRRNIGGTVTNNSGINGVVSTSGIDEPRDVVATPCATPKLVVADQSTGHLTLYTNPVSLPGTATTIATGFTKPVGLAFEDANNLLVTDETLNATFRITGDFCNL
ncbi:MAG: hypothetical protein FJ096_09910 [Deltaproteobacteria bacterium]|nr:hypothetical protein [Deltaproteobacteria bacterium]